jgi:hypothetical protein
VNLPLAEELEVVFNWDSDAIVIIDDFQVSNDPGYRYDDYGARQGTDDGFSRAGMSIFELEQLYPVPSRSRRNRSKARLCGPCKIRPDGRGYVQAYRAAHK